MAGWPATPQRILPRVFRLITVRMQGGWVSGRGPRAMQPTKSEPSLLQPAERAIPATRLSDESSTTLRVDAPPSAPHRVHAPHRPIGPTRQPSTSRPRGERLPESTAQNRSKLPNDFGTADWASVKEPELNPLKNPNHDSAGDEASDLNWVALQAEDIARILDQRLQDVERRERMLNRRAAQIAQHERMFRLWSNDQRHEIERKHRELKHREIELNQRSSDLRWLLVYGDQYCAENNHDLGINSIPDPRFTNVNPAGLDRFAEAEPECELYAEVNQLDFGTDRDGIRRFDSP